MAVPPPRFRPAQLVGGVMAEHPQNVTLSRVLLLSENIRKLGAPKEEDAPEASEAAKKDENAGGEKEDDETARKNRLLSYWLELQQEVNNFIDSSKSPKKDQPPGIKQLLERKEGLFRKHMMGKRVRAGKG